MLTTRSLPTGLLVTRPKESTAGWPAALVGLAAAMALAPVLASEANDGLQAHRAGASCLAIHQAFPALRSGRYLVSKAHAAPVQVQCDMSGDEGGWQVLFNSQNPKKWGTTFGQAGRGEWGIDASGVPDEVSQLRFMRRDTRERKVIPMTVAALYACSLVGDDFVWNGTRYRTWNAYNLGVSTTKNIYPPPEGYVLSGPPCNNDHKSWGFGHRAWIDDRQAWGWDSLDLGPTVFQIAVR